MTQIDEPKEESIQPIKVKEMIMSDTTYEILQIDATYEVPRAFILVLLNDRPTSLYQIDCYGYEPPIGVINE